MSELIDKVCAKCGSHDVKHDTWAVWDTTKQEWVLGDTFDIAYCGKCDGECHIIDAQLPKETPLCSVCGMPQFSTPSGITCKNQHGGAPAKE